MISFMPANHSNTNRVITILIHFDKTRFQTFSLCFYVALLKMWRCHCFYGIKLWFYGRKFLAHPSRRLEWAIVIAQRPSSVVRRPSSSSSVRKLFTFSTSSPKPLDGFWWNLVGMKYSWSLTSVVVFWPDPPRGGSRGGAKIGHRGSPYSRNFFFRPEGYSDKPNG